MRELTQEEINNAGEEFIAYRICPYFNVPVYFEEHNNNTKPIQRKEFDKSTYKENFKLWCETTFDNDGPVEF